MQILSDHTSSQKPPFADVFQNTRFFIRNFFFRKWALKNTKTLKIVSATFLLVRFLSLNESTCQTRKNVFYFTLKGLFVLEKIKF